MTVNIEGVDAPPGEGDGQGIAAIVVLLNSTLIQDVVVSISVMTGGDETATGEPGYKCS